MRERERNLNNPPINEEILNIESIYGLVKFLIDERYSNELDLIHEYSTDEDVEMARLEAEQDKLKELAIKYS